MCSSGVFRDACNERLLSGYGVAVGSSAREDALIQLVGKEFVFGTDDKRFEEMFPFLARTLQRIHGPVPLPRSVMEEIFF